MNENIENRSGRTSLKYGMQNFIGTLEDNEEAKKIYRTTKVLNLFKRAIESVYGESAFLVLQNINSVYILQERDKGQRKVATDEDKLIKRLVVYTCDSMVYADLDSRQEFIKMWLAEHGEHIDKFELLNSKFAMRKRFPYKQDVDELKQKVLADEGAEQRALLDAQYLQGQNLDEINNTIDGIKNEALKQSLKSLISARQNS